MEKNIFFNRSLLAEERAKLVRRLKGNISKIALNSFSLEERADWWKIYEDSDRIAKKFETALPKRVRMGYQDAMRYLRKINY